MNNDIENINILDKISTNDSFLINNNIIEKNINYNKHFYIIYFLLFINISIHIIEIVI